MRNHETVVLAGKEYPVRCNINVLIEVQEQFASLSEFEALIAGIRICKDTDGEILYDEDGKIKFERTEPSLKAIKKILPYMLKEGAAAADMQTDIKAAVTALENVSFNMYEVAVAMHNEYTKCFERKNALSAKETMEEAVKK